MSIQWDEEELMSIGEAAKLIPGRTGRGVATSTVWRWILNGRRGIKLGSVLIGGMRYVTRESLERFVSDLNVSPVVGSSNLVVSRTRLEREREVDNALDSEGI